MKRGKVPFSQGDEEVNVVGAEREDVIVTMCLSFDKVFSSTGWLGLRGGILDPLMLFSCPVGASLLLRLFLPPVWTFAGAENLPPTFCPKKSRQRRNKKSASAFLKWWLLLVLLVGMSNFSSIHLVNSNKRVDRRQPSNDGLFKVVPQSDWLYLEPISS